MRLVWLAARTFRRTLIFSGVWTFSGVGSISGVRIFPVARIFLLAGPVLIAGCADGLVEQQARDAGFVGQPERVLLQSMGKPERTRADGGTMLLTYEQRRLKTVPGAPFCNGPGVWCGGAGFPPPPPVTLVCDTTFAVNGGIVRGFGLRGACG
jgi:hypothetical protein